MNTSQFEDIEQREYYLYLQDGVSVVIFLSTLCVIGTIGNLHVIIVYQRQYNRSNFKLFIIALAINDLLTCVLGMPSEIVRTRYKFTFHGDTFCKISRFFVYIFSNTCGLILSFIAVERSRKICAPFKRQLSHRMVTTSVLMIFIISALISIPTLVYCKILDKPLPLPDHGNLTGTHCACEKNLLYTVHQGAILVLSTVALTVVLVAYTLTARVIFKTKNIEVSAAEENTNVRLVQVNSLNSNETHSDNNNAKLKKTKSSNITQSKKELVYRSSSKTRSQNLARAIRNTIILIVATIISYVGILPVLIIGIIQAVDSNAYAVLEGHLGSAKSILTRLYFVSNVMHPIVYLIMDQKFRTACRDMYVTCIKHLMCRCKSQSLKT